MAFGALVPSAIADHFKVLHSFNGSASDGSNPYEALIPDGKGGFYGTTGGGGSTGCGGSGCGTVFDVTPGGSESVVYAFAGQPDGQGPQSTLLISKSGNIFGTTDSGGTYNDGTIFELASGGGETMLHSMETGKTLYVKSLAILTP
jgi:uncharacterized repeat protein (TIGR03803 family)